MLEETFGIACDSRQEADKLQNLAISLGYVWYEGAVPIDFPHEKVVIIFHGTSEWIQGDKFRMTFSSISMYGTNEKYFFFKDLTEVQIIDMLSDKPPTPSFLDL